MTQIKSEKANAILETEGRFEFRIEGHLIAKKAIMAAETEADERHAKELQELIDKAVEAFTQNCYCAAKMHDNEDCKICYRAKAFAAKLGSQK